MIKTKNYTIEIYEDYLENELSQFEVEQKGYFNGVIVKVDSNRFLISFYDIFRFTQDIAEELENSSYSYECNIIFLKKVTLNNILKAVDDLYKDNKFNANLMVPMHQSL